MHIAFAFDMNEEVSITDLQWNRIAFIANIYSNIFDTIGDLFLLDIYTNMYIE